MRDNPDATQPVRVPSSVTLGGTPFKPMCVIVGWLNPKWWAKDSGVPEIFLKIIIILHFSMVYPVYFQWVVSLSKAERPSDSK